MRYSSRFFLYAPFLSFVALAAAVMIYWWFAATALDKQLNAANGREILPGVKLSFGAKKIAGFPFRLDTLLEDVRVEVATTQGPLIWRTEHFASHRLTYGPSQTIYEAAGRQELSWRDDAGKLHDFVFVPGTMRASSMASKGQLARFDLDIVEIASPDLGAGRVQFHLRRDPALDAIDLALSGDTIKLAPALQAGFGDTIPRLQLEAKLTPETPLAPLLAGKLDWRRAAENWRMHGGKFSAGNFSIKWGHVSATAHGSIILDDAHKFGGDIVLNVTDANALAAVAPNDTKLAAALSKVAARLPKPAEDALSVPLSFRSGNVSAAAMPAGSIGPLY